MKTFKFSLVFRTRENTDVFISLDDNIYGIQSKRINILYIVNYGKQKWNMLGSHLGIVTLTYCSRDTRKRVLGKQCRPRSDATECGVWSGSPLFANSLAIFL